MGGLSKVEVSLEVGQVDVWKGGWYRWGPGFSLYTIEYAGDQVGLEGREGEGIQDDSPPFPSFPSPLPPL